ncbi:hypothetical protein QVD17_13172 [Tagetes erecta]|uniref:Uncharacterized protein n=1 Tax=Tagetes erecta TaxID=13708 RepID=A0AAD8L0E3_TARER|nr:hypothetical protein QVD17_13172 [Tagetes erecta]
MDVHESEKPKPALNAAENNDGTNRRGKSRSYFPLSRAVHAVHSVEYVAKKTIDNRFTNSIWNSIKTTSSASAPSDHKRENHSHETISRDTLQPSLNVEDEQTNLQGTNVNTEGSNVIDQLENLNSLHGSDDCITGSVVVEPVSPSHASLAATKGVKHSQTARGTSPVPARGVSPTPNTSVVPRAKDVNPATVKPYKSSARRHSFFSATNILSAFTKIADTRKEKQVANLKDVAQQLELLYNIQVQWQFANASAEAALDLQRATAEKSLYDMWRAILELRDSLASKKIDISLLTLQLKLYAVLYRQMAYIDEWASIQKEHETALVATTSDLQARSLSLPLTGGITADIKGLQLIIFSTIQVLKAIISCIQSTLSKLDKTHFLASELANLVLHERALLDECEIFLASAAPLHIEECSLRSYLLQCSRTSMNE